MGKFVGIWIDNRKATIVSVENGQEQHQTQESHATRHLRLPGEPKGMSLAKGVDIKYHEDLRIYYKGVLEVIKDAEGVYLFGPGTAKEMLKKAIVESGGPRLKIVAVEPADKMTENQIIAKVKEYFFPRKPAAHAH